MTTASFEHLEVEVEGPIAVLTLDRLDTMNALDEALVAELTHAVAAQSADESLRVLILASKHPKAFVAGADIKAMAQMSGVEKQRFAEAGHRLMATIEQSPLITVAAVGGYCLGGGFELALSCDLLAASSKATFAFPEIGLGLLPGFGGTQRFTRSVGMHRGLRYILSAERFGAAEAEAMGLLWRRFEHGDDFVTRVLEDAADLSKQGPLAAAAIKRLVRQATYSDLATGCRAEIDAFAAIGSSDDTAEGLAAFLEKRPAQFKRR